MNTARRSIPALLCVSLCIAPTLAKADWQYTHWGMTPEQVVAASSGAVHLLPQAERTREDTAHWEISVVGTSTDGGQTLETGFMFDTQGKGLKCVLYNTSGDGVGTLRARLLAKFGKPADANDFPPLRMMSWKTPDDVELDINEQVTTAAVTHCAPGG